MGTRGIVGDAEKAAQCSMELCVETVEKTRNGVACAEGVCGHCVFVAVGDTGSTHCYAPGDPSVRLLEEQYAGLVTITLYDDYLAREEFVHLANVSLDGLATGDLILDTDDINAVNIGDVFGSAGIRGVPDAIDALFQCPDKIQESTDPEIGDLVLHYRPIGRQCCEVSSVRTYVSFSRGHTSTMASAPYP